MWASVVFWSADIFINLNTAVYIQGHLVHSRRAILKRYAGTWLALDFSIVAVDYINLVEDGHAFRAFLGSLSPFSGQESSSQEEKAFRTRPTYNSLASCASAGSSVLCACYGC